MLPETKKSADAKKALTDEGYTVVDKDLNDGVGFDADAPKKEEYTPRTLSA